MIAKALSLFLLHFYRFCRGSDTFFLLSLHPLANTCFLFLSHLLIDFNSNFRLDCKRHWLNLGPSTTQQLLKRRRVVFRSRKNLSLPFKNRIKYSLSWCLKSEGGTPPNSEATLDQKCARTSRLLPDQRLTYFLLSRVSYYISNFKFFAHKREDRKYGFTAIGLLYHFFGV